MRLVQAMVLAASVVAAAFAAAAPESAAVPTSAAEAKPTWADLTPSQRSTLAPLQQQWSTIDANRKAKWLVVAQRFPSLPAAERERVQARMAEWVRLSPIERGRARQTFQELRSLPVDDRQALWEAYNALPPEQKQELAARARPAARPSEPVASTAAVTAKRNTVPMQAPVSVKAVSPTVVQAKPGATTNLVTRTATPPAHNQPGLPKIVATEKFVNPATLLPRRGPQGAATVVSAASASTPAPVAAASAAPVVDTPGQ